MTTTNYIKEHNNLYDEILNAISDMVDVATFRVFSLHKSLIPECLVMGFNVQTRTYEEHIVDAIFIKEGDLTLQTNKTKSLRLEDCDVLSLAKLHDTMVMQLAELEKNFLENSDKLDTEPSYSKRMLIVPNEYLTDDIEDEKFMTLAFHKGMVLTPEEYAKAHNNYGLGVCIPEVSTIKVFDFTNTIIEYCPHCDSEVVLESHFAVQTCPICKNKIAPCNLCDTCVKDCPLKKELETK